MTPKTSNEHVEHATASRARFAKHLHAAPSWHPHGHRQAVCHVMSNDIWQHSRNSLEAWAHANTGRTSDMLRPIVNLRHLRGTFRFELGLTSRLPARLKAGARSNQFAIFRPEDCTPAEKSFSKLCCDHVTAVAT